MVTGGVSNAIVSGQGVLSLGVFDGGLKDREYREGKYWTAYAFDRAKVRSNVDTRTSLWVRAYRMTLVPDEG